MLARNKSNTEWKAENGKIGRTVGWFNDHEFVSNFGLTACERGQSEGMQRWKCLHLDLPMYVQKWYIRENYSSLVFFLTSQVQIHLEIWMWGYFPDNEVQCHTGIISEEDQNMWIISLLWYISRIDILLGHHKKLSTVDWFLISSKLGKSKSQLSSMSEERKDLRNDCLL